MVLLACKAQAESNRTRSLAVEVVPEEGCPVSIINTKVDLILDPFDAVEAAVIYLDYKNVGQKTIEAVKFRFRFVDKEGKDKGTFQGSHASLVTPGGQSKQKWRHEKIHPDTVSLLVKVLAVKEEQGISWESKTAASEASAAPVTAPPHKTEFVPAAQPNLPPQTTSPQASPQALPLGQPLSTAEPQALPIQSKSSEPGPSPTTAPGDAFSSP